MTDYPYRWVRRRRTEACFQNGMGVGVVFYPRKGSWYTWAITAPNVKPYVDGRTQGLNNARDALIARYEELKQEAGVN